MRPTVQKYRARVQLFRREGARGSTGDASGGIPLAGWRHRAVMVPECCRVMSGSLPPKQGYFESVFGPITSRFLDTITILWATERCRSGAPGKGRTMPARRRSWRAIALCVSLLALLTSCALTRMPSDTAKSAPESTLASPDAHVVPLTILHMNDVYEIAPVAGGTQGGSPGSRPCAKSCSRSAATPSPSWPGTSSTLQPWAPRGSTVSA